ncbi:CAMKK/META protein kinase [Nannizzia gypsea CBS 118893]|uniref:CAMKK/META protein kinase n=1 Tax=Arthroderma gypseum (strain ATCC MYA-4604 / CBS 118893) TaxID=535722 RepID=E4UUA5_ARTGP|nr:CAMKK/META protein kinase [Nannizzia gypsea CBS 118893]EFR00872.1 CAMKK/META protein kinase [Nannizzia gypsea CBS 118893]
MDADPILKHGRTAQLALDTEVPTSRSSEPGPNALKGARPASGSYDSPLRQHARYPTAPRQVKETLNAQSTYTNSQDDNTAEHRINQYLIKQEIGRGSFGAVHLATDQYGQEYAVKEFSKSRLRKRAQSHGLRRRTGKHPGVQPAGVGFNSPLHRHPSGIDEGENGNSLYLIREEIAIMKKLNHSNLVSLIEVLDDPTEDSLYMVMEMCKKGVIMKVGLGEQADPYSEENCRCWFRDLILGIEYLHAQGIVHRDIKPDNCLLTNDDVLKVVDFGVSEMFEKSSDMFIAKSAGSPAFIPPELCVAKYGEVSGRAVDVWSMGVTLYCLRYGRIPFHTSNIFDLYNAIRNDEVELPGETNEAFKDLMKQILEKDPAKRITMPQLRVHPWVTKGGIDPLLSEEENTATLVGPPTEEEMDSAITRNLGHALIVVKAVQKFKRLISDGSPLPMESILGEGEESHFVQPPLLMGEDEEEEFSAILHNRNMKEHVYPRRPDQPKRPSQATMNSSPYVSLPPPNTFEPCAFPSPQPQSTPGADTPTRQTGSEGTRGHARDPLEEEMPFLNIGPSNFGSEAELNPTNDTAMESGGIPIPSKPAVTESPMIVSESPPAADIDIYETAYKEIIERINSRSREAQSPTPKVYLNRRVEKKPTASSGLWSVARKNSKLSSPLSRSVTDTVPDNRPPRPSPIKRFTAAAASFAASSGKQSPSPLAKAVQVNDAVRSDEGIEPNPLDTSAAVIETTASPTALSPVDDAKKDM